MIREVNDGRDANDKGDKAEGEKRVKIRIVLLSRRIIIIAVIVLLAAGLMKASDSYAQFR